MGITKIRDDLSKKKAIKHIAERGITNKSTPDK